MASNAFSTILNPMEKEVLQILVENEGRLVTYEQFAQVDSALAKPKAVAVYVCGLRKSIQGKIITRRGYGYIYDRF